PLEKIFSMFGSNDDKKAPAEAGEKKGLFGWLRKKPQAPAAEPPPSEPLEDSQPFADKPDEQAQELLAENEPVAAQASQQPEPEPEAEVTADFVPVESEPERLAAVPAE